MAGLRYYSYERAGKWMEETNSYSSAVRVGDRIECSGQGGWDPTMASGSLEFPKTLEEEIDQAFKNVDLAVRAAGGKGWSQVFRVNTYVMDIPASQARIVENYRKWMTDHKPIWTLIQVPKFGPEAMHVEIEVVAYDPEGSKA